MPTPVLWLWELAKRSEGATTRKTISNVKLVNGEKVSKKYQGAMTLSLKVHTLELPIQQRAKCQKFKNGYNLTIFNVNGLRFCTPPVVHKNEQLLFVDQMDFWTSAGHSSTVEGLLDPQRVPE